MPTNTTTTTTNVVKEDLVEKIKLLFYAKFDIACLKCDNHILNTSLAHASSVVPYILDYFSNSVFIPIFVRFPFSSLHFNLLLV